MEEKGNYKFKIYNGLTLTADKDSIVEIANNFILKLIGFKRGLLSIKDIDENEYQCPMLCVFKILVYIFDHSFLYNPLIFQYLKKAEEDSVKFKDNNVLLENWEVSWLNLIKAIVNHKKEEMLSICLKIAEEYPNDLINLKIGIVLGLYSGEKTFLNHLGELHYKYENNHNEGNFIGLFSFILEEARQFEESEKWVRKGIEIAPANIWIQHVYAHILYQTKRVQESIQYLEERSNMWSKEANPFLFKHIYWHLAIAYMEFENYEKSNFIIDQIVMLGFDDAECPLAILGYILRIYIRSDGSLKSVNIDSKWIIILLQYFTNELIYTKHMLFDCLSVWLISYILNNPDYLNNSLLENENTNSKLTDTKTLLNKVLVKIKENVQSLEFDSENEKIYYNKNYLNLLEAMVLFGESKYQNVMEILRSEENAIWKIGASDEQLFVLFEVELYCSYKCSDVTNFQRIMEIIYADLAELNYIKKIKEKLNILN